MSPNPNPDLTPTLRQKQWLFDRWAPSYDWTFPSIFYQALHLRLQDFLHPLSAQTLSPQAIPPQSLPPQAHILDLGCGTGKLLNRLARSQPQLTGIGFDLSPVMLHQAQRASCDPTRLTYQQGNAAALPYPAEQFDAIFNSISFLHYPDPIAVLREVRRTLKPQGLYYLIDFSPRWASQPTVIGQSIGPFNGPANSNSGSTIRFYSPAVRQQLAAEAGLTTIAQEYLLGPVLLSIFAPTT